MIFDRCDSFSRYPVFTPEARTLICAFLEKVTPDIPLGKTMLSGEKLFASVSTYQTKTEPMQAMPETHREYCDIQLLAEGAEDIFVGDVSGLAENAPYKPDCTLYRNDGSWKSCCRMVPGVFAVFFPGEGHLPCIAADGVSKPVKKIVIKVAKECLTF